MSPKILLAGATGNLGGLSGLSARTLVSRGVHACRKKQETSFVGGSSQGTTFVYSAILAW